jgi:hypothetical protein
MAVRLSALRAGRPLPPGRFLVLISVRGWVDTRAIVRLEGYGQLKKSNPRPSGLWHSASTNYPTACHTCLINSKTNWNPVYSQHCNDICKVDDDNIETSHMIKPIFSSATKLFKEFKILLHSTSIITQYARADHSGRVVWGVNRNRPLEHWDQGFESHLRHGCLRACVVLCVGSGLATGWSPVQGVLPCMYR